jgi:hypothetical protein
MKPHGSLVFLVTSTLLAVLVACSRAEPPPPPPCPSAVAGTPVDPKLMAFLSRARAAHHSADRYEDQTQLPRAIGVLEELVEGPAPGAQTSAPSAVAAAPKAREARKEASSAHLAPEVREVLADTQARLADLKSRQDDFSGAERHLDLGLDLVPEQSYFRGHLFEIQGLVAERHAKARRDAGDERQAKEFEQRALHAFEQAMQIQAEVIDAAVGSEAP